MIVCNTNRWGRSPVRSLLTLLIVMCVALWAHADVPGKKLARVFEVANEADLGAMSRNGPLRAGDVLVLSPLRLVKQHGFSRQAAEGKRSSEDEPVYVVGRALYEHVLHTRALTKADLENSRRARRQLADAALEAQVSDDRADGRPGSRVDTRLLTALAGQQFTFDQGEWVFAGFDLEGYTERGSLIVIGSKVDAIVNMLFAGNRISNCDSAFRNCLWSGTSWKGEKRNGGSLIRVRSTSVGTKIHNNTFENLRGFVLVFVDAGSADTEVIRNTFRHLRRWGSNAAEALHLSVGFPLQSPDQEPYFSRLNNRVAYNLFEDANAEGELIGIKGAGDRIIGNWIINSHSGISLRDGADTLIEGNTIIRSYGIRVMGDRQIVRNNHIVLPIRNYGIWFENGARRPGNQCLVAFEAAGRKIWRATGRLSWFYRQARDPIVTGNTVEVPPGGEAKAIARWNRSKDCGWDRCDGDPSSRVPCDRQLSDTEMARILAPATGNDVRAVSNR